MWLIWLGIVEGQVWRRNLFILRGKAILGIYIFSFWRTKHGEENPVKSDYQMLIAARVR